MAEKARNRMDRLEPPAETWDLNLNLNLNLEGCGMSIVSLDDG